MIKPPKALSKAMNKTSQELRSLIIAAQHRLADLQDWINRVPLPPRSSVELTIAEWKTPNQMVTLWVCFNSFKDCQSWAWVHTKCFDAEYGWDNRYLLRGDGNKSWLHLQMPDFLIKCSIPTDTIEPKELHAVQS